jgi:hypothetical protein
MGTAVFLRERRRGDGGSENYHGAESFQVGHLSSPLLRVSANALTAIWLRNPPTPLNDISFIRRGCRAHIWRCAPCG